MSQDKLMGLTPDNPSPNPRRYFINRSAWRYYLNFYRGRVGPLTLSIALSIGQSLVVLPIAFLIKEVFDDIIPAGNLSHLTLAGGAVVLLYLLSGGATLWARHVALRTTKTAIQEFREELLKNLYSFPRAFHTDADQGKLHTIMVQDTERLDVMTNAILAQLMPALFVSLTVGAVLLYLNWFLFVVLLGAVPLFFALSKALGNVTQKKVHAFHRSFETFSKGIMFVLKNIELTRTQAAEQWEMERQRGHLDDLRLASGRMAWMRAAYISAQSITIAMASIVILVIGGRAVITGAMTLGDLLSFYAVLAFLRPHLYTISSSIPQLIEGNQSLGTLHGLMDTHLRSPYPGARRIPFSGNVAFDCVEFSYNSSRPLLRGLTFSIDPASTVAVIGPNGSGKTTIANLILGFYRPQAGRLFTDGHPFDDLDVAHLRRHIGVVAQHPVIFAGSIRENVTYGCQDVTDQEVEHALDLSGAREFISRLPRGLDTSMGEGGLRLSGGQCQQIAIARALLRRPALLILDEPTNHLDAGAVRHLMDNLRALDGSTTIIILSHDREVVREADQVLTLDEGRIVSSQSPPLEAPSPRPAGR